MDFKGEGPVENIGYNGLREGDKERRWGEMTKIHYIHA